jgi:hypothetical protein
MGATGGRTGNVTMPLYPPGADLLRLGGDV